MIKKTQNVIIAYYQRFKSYFREANIRSLISEKPHVWSPIIADFSIKYVVMYDIYLFCLTYAIYFSLYRINRRHRIKCLMI